MNSRRFFFGWMHVLLALCLGAALTAQAGFRRVNAPNPNDPMAVQIFQLDNGLTVYLSENHETPRFYSEIAVRAGSKHDPAETTGLAHYLEHLLFKGTETMGTLDYAKEKPHLDRITELYEQHFREKDPAKRAEIYAEINKESQLASQFAIPNEMDKLYKGMGEEHLNAHTWHEETIYKVGLPANRLRQWAKIEAERFARPVFRLFQPELEIVYEEKNQTLDNKDRIIHYAVDALLFKKHPYGQQTTIGEVEHLKNPSLVNVMNFFRTYYVPNNMAICISGDIKIADTIKLIDENFSTWKGKPLPEPKHWAEEPLNGAERVTVKYQGDEQVMLAFRTSGRTSADADALQLADMVLDNSTAGLINLNLNQKQKVRSASASRMLNNDYGTEYLIGTPKKGQTLPEVEKLLLEQIELLKQGKFDDWIIPAIITDFKKREKGGLESDVARVSAMHEAFIAFEDWDHSVDEIARMEKLTKADVVRVANKFFGTNLVAAYRLDEQHKVPAIEKPKIDKIQIDSTRQSAFAKQILEMPVKELEPVFVNPAKDYQITNYAEGVKLYYSKNPINDLFVLTISVELGERHDNRLRIATRLLDKSGTPRFSSEALKQEWYKLGTDFSVGAGENESFITISGLDENFAASLALLLEVMNQPVAEPGTLEELIKIILVQREDAKKDFRAIAGAVSSFNRYGKDSPQLKILPTDAVQKLTTNELHGLTKSLLGYKHAISYTGSLPLEKLLAVLKAKHSITAALKNPPSYQFLKVRDVEQNQILFFNKEMAQAQVRIEFGQGEFNEANMPAIELYNDYFGGGMSGIVFQELREARALAYGAGARYVPGGRVREQNVMIGGISCQTDKTMDAVDAFLDLLDQLPKSEDRFKETFDGVLTSYRSSKLGFREVLGAVRSWERLQVPVDPRRTRYEKIQKGDLAQVMEFHRANLKARPKLISIVGDKKKIDLERLGKQAKVTEVSLKDIFVN
ncbi:MAG: insulinase family protein [Verrucomicrobia bacterium]|nr:insulinase family protein [Verrucomicrobiota bacterium]